MEINLSIDEHGRTRCDDSDKLDFSSKSVPTNLSSLPQTDLDDLLYDAEIADCGLMPRTFWMPETEVASCWMEQLAQQVFQHHTKDVSHHPTSSGAEWWVQIRPSPPSMGRYALLAEEDDEDSKSSITFHWDKDEDLRILAGGNLYVHPHISTVTYLSCIGAPTVIMEDFRVDNVTGDWVVPEQQPQAVVSWPRTGKHLSFDGRFLHAAPREFIEDEVWKEQIKIPDGPEDEAAKKLLSRRHRRVTFLVNIWLNYKPFNTDRFPMSEKMTKSKPEFSLFRGDSDDEVSVVVMPTSGRTITWPMGGCDSESFIHMRMDPNLVQASKDVDTFQLTWNGSFGVVLSKGHGEPAVEGRGVKRSKQVDDEQNDIKKAATNPSR